jgi:hypothetical protein
MYFALSFVGTSFAARHLLKPTTKSFSSAHLEAAKQGDNRNDGENRVNQQARRDTY